MNCERPLTLDGKAFGCGQCLPCRLNTRRVWTHRIMLEQACYNDNAFVTLTYSDEKLPSDLSVSPREISLFIKRLRKKIPQKIRYFACGEYGDNTFRPHYHLALFNYPQCYRGVTRHTRSNEPCCPVCTTISDAWGLGGVSLGTLERASAAYIAAYTVKKMTKDDDARLEGRLPEFARMSRRPGIGVGFMDDVASALMEHNLDEKMLDVPLTLSHGSHQFPLGRFLRRKLRVKIGRDEKCPTNLPPTPFQIQLQEMRSVAFANSTPLKNEILKASEGKRIQIEARHNRFKKRSQI